MGKRVLLTLLIFLVLLSSVHAVINYLGHWYDDPAKEGIPTNGVAPYTPRYWVGIPYFVNDTPTQSKHLIITIYYNGTGNTLNDYAHVFPITMRPGMSYYSSFRGYGGISYFPPGSAASSTNVAAFNVTTPWGVFIKDTVGWPGGGGLRIVHISRATLGAIPDNASAYDAVFQYLASLNYTNASFYVYSGFTNPNIFYDSVIQYSSAAALNHNVGTGFMADNYSNFGEMLDIRSTGTVLVWLNGTAGAVFPTGTIAAANGIVGTMQYVHSNVTYGCSGTTDLCEPIYVYAFTGNYSTTGTGFISSGEDTWLGGVSVFNVNYVSFPTMLYFGDQYAFVAYELYGGPYRGNYASKTTVLEEHSGTYYVNGHVYHNYVVLNITLGQLNEYQYFYPWKIDYSLFNATAASMENSTVVVGYAYSLSFSPPSPPNGQKYYFLKPITLNATETIPVSNITLYLVHNGNTVSYTCFNTSVCYHSFNITDYGTYGYYATDSAGLTTSQYNVYYYWYNITATPAITANETTIVQPKFTIDIFNTTYAANLSASYILYNGKQYPITNSLNQYYASITLPFVQTSTTLPVNISLYVPYANYTITANGTITNLPYAFKVILNGTAVIHDNANATYNITLVKPTGSVATIVGATVNPYAYYYQPLNFYNFTAASCSVVGNYTTNSALPVLASLSTEQAVLHFPIMQTHLPQNLSYGSPTADIQLNLTFTLSAAGSTENVSGVSNKQTVHLTDIGIESMLETNYSKYTTAWKTCVEPDGYIFTPYAINYPSLTLDNGEIIYYNITMNGNTLVSSHASPFAIVVADPSQITNVTLTTQSNTTYYANTLIWNKALTYIIEPLNTSLEVIPVSRVAMASGAPVQLQVYQCVQTTEAPATPFIIYFTENNKQWLITAGTTQLGTAFGYYPTPYIYTAKFITATVGIYSQQIYSLQQPTTSTALTATIILPCPQINLPVSNLGVQTECDWIVHGTPENPSAGVVNCSVYGPANHTYTINCWGNTTNETISQVGNGVSLYCTNVSDVKVTVDGTLYYYGRSLGFKSGMQPIVAIFFIVAAVILTPTLIGKAFAIGLALGLGNVFGFFYIPPGIIVGYFVFIILWALKDNGVI